MLLLLGGLAANRWKKLARIYIRLRGLGARNMAARIRPIWWQN